MNFVAEFLWISHKNGLFELLPDVGEIPNANGLAVDQGLLN